MYIRDFVGPGYRNTVAPWAPVAFLCLGFGFPAGEVPMID